MNKDVGTRLGIAILGIAIGFGVCYGISKGPSKPLTPLTDADVAKELVQSFKEVEAVCGKDNVDLVCNDYTSGCGDTPDGFTCDSWTRALHPEDYDKYGRLIREQELYNEMGDWR